MCRKKKDSDVHEAK